MPVPTRNVVLTERQADLIETLVESGRYQNASEVLRDGLRLVEQREAEDASKRIAQNGRADMAHVHRLGDVRRAEVDYDVSRPTRLFKEQGPAPGSLLECGIEGRGLQFEIEKARACDVHLLAQIINLEPSHDISRQLARVHLARLCERHEGVALVIPKTRVGAGTNQHGAGISIREQLADDILQAYLDGFAR